MDTSLSLILLPTLACNVDCEYCFEDKTSDVLTHDRLAEMVAKVLDHMARRRIDALMIYWQGGEIMTMPPQWFDRAYELIGEAAEARGIRVGHALQSNMIGYTKRWNGLIARMFGNSVGTSMDFPNLYRKPFHGGPDDYTRIWRKNVDAARDAGVDISVIAVPNRATLDVGAERFYSYFVDELRITDFQVNTPFPGGESNDVKRELPLDLDDLTRFYVDLLDVWMARGYEAGVKVGPVDELVSYFGGGDACLPCIWQSNCTDNFVSIDARGNVAQCDCWVTSYPEHFFGNVFESESFTDLLENSPARDRFLARPAAVVDQGCLACEFLALCHGGCPVRTFTIRGTLLEKDPYCGLYKSLFARAREAAREAASQRSGVVAPAARSGARAGGGTCCSTPKAAGQAPLVALTRGSTSLIAGERP